MFTSNSTRLLRHADRTLERLIDKEKKSKNSLSLENFSVLRKTMKNFIKKINAKLSPKVLSNDEFIKDLQTLTEYTRYTADQINSTVLAREKELFKKYFRERGHYKLDLLEKYYNNYFSINVPDSSADPKTWENYHNSINSFKSSLEGAHSSFVSHILEEVREKEDEYISNISRYFDQVIADQFAVQMERVELCNRLKLPADNYLSGFSGKKSDGTENKSKNNEQYQTASLRNAEQQKFLQPSDRRNNARRQEKYNAAGKEEQKKSSSENSSASGMNKTDKSGDRYETIADQMMDDYKNNRTPENNKSDEHTGNNEKNPQRQENYERNMPAGNYSENHTGENNSRNGGGQEKKSSGKSADGKNNSSEGDGDSRTGNEEQKSSGAGCGESSGKQENKKNSQSGKENISQENSSESEKNNFSDLRSQRQRGGLNGQSGEGADSGYPDENQGRRGGEKNSSSSDPERSDGSEQKKNSPNSREESRNGVKENSGENGTQSDTGGENNGRSSRIDEQTRFLQELSDALNSSFGNEESANRNGNDGNGISPQNEIPDNYTGTGQYMTGPDMNPGSSAEGEEINAAPEYDLGNYFDLEETGDIGSADLNSDQEDGTSSGGGESDGDYDAESSKSIMDYLKELGYDENGIFDPNPSNFWTHQYWQIPKMGGKFIPYGPQNSDDQTSDNASAQQEELPENDGQEPDPDEQLIDELVESILFNKGNAKKNSFNKPGKNKGAETTGNDQFIHYFKVVEHSKGLQKLLNRLGRCMDLDRAQNEKARRNENSGNRKKTEDSRESLSGITLGNEISYVLPQELVKLNDPAVEPLFDVNYLERNLIRFDLDGIADLNGEQEKIPSSPSHERGPVILCIDTSSSMQGIPESYAKAIVMSLATKCVSASRDCFIINFSVTIEKLLVNKNAANAEKTVTEFLCKSFNGGSDLDEALTECLRLMENDPAFYRSDVLCVTDGKVKYSQSLIDLIRNRKKHEKNNFFELLVSTDYEDQYFNSEENYDLIDPMKLFDVIFKLNRDGNTLTEFRNNKIKAYY